MASKAIKAAKKLDAGPAADMSMLSRLGFLKLAGLTGTGLAQPKGGAPMMMRMAGIRTVPMGSICGAGFKVILPMIWAVGSPNL